MLIRFADDALWRFILSENVPKPGSLSPPQRTRPWALDTQESYREQRLSMTIDPQFGISFE